MSERIWGTAVKRAIQIDAYFTLLYFTLHIARSSACVVLALTTGRRRCRSTASRMSVECWSVTTACRRAGARSTAGQRSVNPADPTRSPTPSRTSSSCRASSSSERSPSPTFSRRFALRRTFPRGCVLICSVARAKRATWVAFMDRPSLIRVHGNLTGDLKIFHKSNEKVLK